MNHVKPLPEQTLAGVERVLAEREGLLSAYVFGSRATGDATAGSDLDIAVLYSAPLSLQELIRIEIRLEEAARIPVDLIDLRRASPFLALDVVRGVRFVCTDPVTADEYELYVLRRAGDLEHLERERRAMILGRAAP
jgi:predicted nucleotidyltransferase